MILFFQSFQQFFSDGNIVNSLSEEANWLFFFIGLIIKEVELLHLLQTFIVFKVCKELFGCQIIDKAQELIESQVQQSFSIDTQDINANLEKALPALLFKF